MNDEFDTLFGDDDFVESVLNTKPAEPAKNVTGSFDGKPTATTFSNEEPPAVSAPAPAESDTRRVHCADRPEQPPLPDVTSNASPTHGHDEQIGEAAETQAPTPMTEAENLQDAGSLSRSLRRRLRLTRRHANPDPKRLSQTPDVQRKSSPCWLFFLCYLAASGLCFQQSGLWDRMPGSADASVSTSNLPQSTLPDSTRKPDCQLRSVAEFQVGDPILAFNHETGQVEVRHVQQAFKRISDHLRIVTFVDADGTKQTIKTTNEHPFWIVGESRVQSRESRAEEEKTASKWHEVIGGTQDAIGSGMSSGRSAAWPMLRQGYVPAKELQHGDKVRGPTGELLWVLETRYEPHPKGIPVYNCEVEGDHNYFVTATGSRAPPVLAHNAECSLPDLPDEYARAFDGPVRTRTFNPGDVVHRSPQLDELANNPGAWFGTRRTATRSGTDSLYNLADYNPLKKLRTYRFKKSITLYYGKVAGGSGFQVLFPKGAKAKDYLDFLSEAILR